jgi:hypothetical protein
MDPQPLPAPAPEKINWRLVVRGVVLIVLLALCGFGLAASPFWKQHSLEYWIRMVPCFGGASLLMCLLSEGQRQRKLRWKVLKHQVLQWIGTGAAVYLVFWLIQQKFLNADAAGPAVTILMALSLYVAGITFDWPLIVVALLLAGMAVGAVYLEKVWLVVVGLAVLLIVAYLLLRPMIRNYRTSPVQESTPEPSDASVASEPHAAG